MDFMEMGAMTAAEALYCYSQSQQIGMQTGLIGYLRADMDSNGKGFFSSWTDFNKSLKTDEFKVEFDSVINALREKGNALHNRTSMQKFCYAPDNAYPIGTDGREFGIRVNTTTYTYMMRLNPNKGEYNLYCFCFFRKWLEEHMKRAECGIRFISPNYDALFTIKDGESIYSRRNNGTMDKRGCRFVDEYHLELGSSLYHICEFSEICEKNSIVVWPEKEDGVYRPIIESMKANGVCEEDIAATIRLVQKKRTNTK